MASKQPSARRRSATGKVSRRATARSSAPPYRSVVLRLHSIKCVKTTKEIDRDEIVITAVITEGQVRVGKKKNKFSAKAKKGASIYAGKFKKGTSRSYKKPRTLARFPYGGKKKGWPRYYVAMMVFIEKDEGHIGAVVNTAVKSVEKELKAALTTAAATAATAALAGTQTGAAIGSVVPVPIVGTAVGAAAGAAVGIALGEIKKARADDVFDPKRVQLRLKSAPGRIGGISETKKTVVFKGFKGVYRVTYSWAVS